jgi:DNA polymerase I-like protein with 3'-5' exonuclease and polymerase domains
MNLDKAFIGDIETTGLLRDMGDKPEDLHVFSCAYKSGESYQIKSSPNLEDVKKVVGDPNNTIVFHNGISFDRPALEKLGVEFKAEIIDTLGISYYLYSERSEHGLAGWGEFFGVPKPEIEDWQGLTYEEYRHRCEEDVKINTNLWVMMLKYLRNLYNNDDAMVVRVIRYLNQKLYALRLQEKNPLFLDLEKADKNLKYLEEIIKEKTDELISIMPPKPVYAKRTPPKKPYKKDGTLSATGERWFDLLKRLGLPEDHTEDVKEVVSYEEPNPGSSQQMKDFLFSKGWQPKIYKDGANGKVPQLRDDDKNLCESIQKLIKTVPELEALDGLSVAQHRAGYLKSFLDKSDENGYCSAWAHAFTRTLRLKHVAPFVNMPKPSATHGELVRSCIVAPPGYVCIGADLSSIEDKCKQISIFPYDPDYVESMNTKGWDAHLALGKVAGLFTEDEVQFYKWRKSLGKGEPFGECPDSFKEMSDEEQSEAFHEIDKRRATAKTTNYACTYGAGVAKIAESADMPKKDARKLHKGYWDMNWAVKQFAKDRTVKTVQGTNWLALNKKAGGLKKVEEVTWIWNEFSNLWLFLKNDKDRFSACNQNFGVKVFDVWGWILMNQGIEPSFQAHDEYLWYCKEEDVEKHTEILNRSVERLNEIFQPPVPIEIDFNIGANYAEVH